MQTQYSMLGYRIDLYFYDYKLALEIDKNDHDDRDLEYVKKKAKRQEKLGCEFIRIDPDKKEFDIHKAINEIFRHVKQLSTKTLINKNSKRLLGSEFKSDNVIKSKVIKYIAKKILSNYESRCLILLKLSTKK